MCFTVLPTVFSAKTNFKENFEKIMTLFQKKVLTKRVSYVKLTHELGKTNQRIAYGVSIKILMENIYERRISMMPLIYANVGENSIIRKIGGSAEMKKHLENLGFVVGGTVKIINRLSGNVIVNVKETRVAISKEMAQKIMI